MSSIVLAELSDKTTLATVTLASDHDWVGVWIGTTAGMVAANGLAIVAGVLLHRRLPERLLHLMAGLLFLAFGLWMLLDGALGWRWVAVAVIGAVALVATTAALRSIRRRRRLADPPVIAGVPADAPLSIDRRDVGRPQTNARGRPSAHIAPPRTLGAAIRQQSAFWIAQRGRLVAGRPAEWAA